MGECQLENNGDIVAFHNLVHDTADEIDFVGMFAFCLYKKREITHLTAQHRKGQTDDRQAVANFQEIVLHEKGGADSLINDAQNMVKLFSEDLLQKEKKELKTGQEILAQREEKLNHQETELKKREQRVKELEKCPRQGGFGFGVLQSVIGSLLFTIICAVIILLVNMKTDLAGYINKIIIHAQTTEQAPIIDRKTGDGR
jgi:hypothetical protein